MTEPQASEWQPIETANLESLGHVIGSDGKSTFVMWYDDFERKWQRSTSDAFDDPVYPTHWMPMPDPVSVKCK